MPTRKSLFDLKYAIAGFLNRQPNTFIVNSRNNLLTAINNAKDFVQRAIDFEYARVSVLVPNVSLIRGGNLDNAVLFEEEFGSPMPGTYPEPFYGPTAGGLPVQIACPSPANPPPCQPPSAYGPRTPPQYWGGPFAPMEPHFPGGGGGRPLGPSQQFPRQFSPFGSGWSGGSSWDDTPPSWRMFAPEIPPPPHVDLKKVLIGYLPFVDNTGVAPMKIYSKQEWADRRRRMSDEFTSLRISEAKSMLAATGFGIIMDGKKFFVDPQSPQVFGWQNQLNVFFDGIRWLEDFDDVEQCQSHQQFLLDYAFDILLYRAVTELNFFLKEDERVNISSKQWDVSWNNVMQWNATIFGNTTDVSLD
jgi:hypothetical protein